MKSPIYHVGLLAKGKTAVLQYRKDKDCLSCEILAYFGRRETTKADARKRLASTPDALTCLNAEFTKRQFNRIIID